jgi:hypothetical protein
MLWRADGLDVRSLVYWRRIPTPIYSTKPSRFSGGGFYHRVNFRVMGLQRQTLKNFATENFKDEGDGFYIAMPGCPATRSPNSVWRGSITADGTRDAVAKGHSHCCRLGKLALDEAGRLAPRHSEVVLARLDRGRGDPSGSKLS